MAIDDFAGMTVGLDSSYTHLAAVAPSDTVDLVHASRALICAVGGTVTLISTNGEQVQVTLVAGFEYRIRASRVMLTGTGATGIVALW
jgi:hypothetical protein